MSDNTYIEINPRTFRVTRRDADSGRVLWTVGKGKTFEEACDLASRELYEAGIPPEYGIVFKGGEHGKKL